MTLTAEQSSNKEMFEKMPVKSLITIIRTAMGEGRITPCHVYDAVDEIICRVEKLEEDNKNLNAALKPVLDIDISALERYPLDEEDLEEINVYSPMDNGLYEDNCFTKAAQKAILRSPNAIRKAKEIYNKENKA